MRYPTRGYQTRSRASNQTRHEGAGLPEDDIENGPILGAESGDGAIMPLDRKIYISVREPDPFVVQGALFSAWERAHALALPDCSSGAP